MEEPSIWSLKDQNADNLVPKRCFISPTLMMNFIITNGLCQY